MKILNKEETSRTIYYSIDAELDDGTDVQAILIVMDALDVPDYVLNITNSGRKLTDKEKEQLEKMAIEASVFNN